VVIAIVASVAALWLAFNLRGSAQRVGSAFIMGLAVCGMHYTGMAAVELDGMVMSDAMQPNTITTPVVIFVAGAAAAGAMLYFASQDTQKKTNSLVFS